MLMATPLPTGRSAPATVAQLRGGIGGAMQMARAGLRTVADGGSAQPDIYVADFVHFLTILHGEVPSLVDLIIEREAELADMLAPAAAQFRADREWLGQLSVETGPAIELTGLSQAETVVRGVRTAMHTLVGSPRDGCALGAAFAFLLDWPELRTDLDAAGTLAFSARWPASPADWPPAPFGPVEELARTRLAEGSAGRAVSFGAAQFTRMHVQLLELVDARAAARLAASDLNAGQSRS